jgi:hypothetical protein
MSWNRPLSWLSRFASRSSRRRPLSSRRSRPRLELLEDRWVPTTVTNLQDSGVGSLREAISATPGGGLIDFKPGLTGTITLFTGQLIILNDVTIQGPGANLLTISGNHASRIFGVETANLTISGLTLANGNAIPDLTTIAQGGGAIFNLGGTVTLNNCVVSNNSNTQPADSTFLPFSGGGGIYNTFFPSFVPIPGVVILNNTTFSANVGNTNLGAGIFNDVGCTVEMDHNVLTGNGGVDVSGGALYNLGKTNIVNSTIANNVTTVNLTPGLGAGIFNQGVLDVLQSTISGNLGANNGGGIYTTGTGSSLNVTLSTIANNKITNGRDGGGIWNNGTLVTINASTIAGNSASHGGGMFIALGSIPQISLTNTIVATNTAFVFGPDVDGNINKSTNSLYGDGTGLNGVNNGVNGNQVGTGGHVINPLLGVLQNNGGPTATMALLQGSPAIDAGTNQGAAATDQRGSGFNRIINNTADIGAYEYQPPATTTVLASSPNPTGQGSPVTFTATVTANAPGSNTPLGTVTFRDGTTALGTVSLDATGKATFTTSGLTLGTHSITATYNGFVLGDYHFSTSPSNTVSQIVLTKTTTTVASALNPSNVNDSVTLTATVTGSGGQPTGMVSFFDNGALLGTGMLSNGQAMLTTAFTTPGIHPITATYSHDNNFGSSTSLVLPQSVGPTTTTIMGVSLNPSNVNDPVSYTVHVSPVVPSSTAPTGIVDLFEGTKLLGSGSLNGGDTLITLPASTFIAGMHSITAVYEGDSTNYVGSTSTAVVQTVGATTTTLMVTPGQSSVGDMVTLTATVSPLVPSSLTPTGSVEFFDGTASLGKFNLNGGTMVSTTVSTFKAGQHPILAVYTSGDNNFSNSKSLVITEIVGPTTTTLVNAPPTSSVNQTITLTATVVANLPTSSKPGGSVKFFDGSTLLGSATLVQSTGMATFTYSQLTAGTHFITATYSGDSNFSTSTSTAVTQTVNKTATMTVLTANPSQPFFTQTVTLTATVTATLPGSIVPGMTVSFYDNNNLLGTANVVNGKATFSISTLKLGTHPITAAYNGDPNFLPSSTSASLTVKPLNFFAVGGPPGRVLVYKPDNTLVADFAPYGPAYTDPINVALGDINGDGYYDLVTAAAVGNPDVRIYDGKAFATGTFNAANPDASLLAQFFAYDLNFNVGANVAVGDISGNGFADLVTAANVGNPDVRVYSGKDIANHTFNPTGSSLLAQFFAYGVNFNIGANVAVGDVNGDGFADLVTGATGGNPDIHVYNGQDIAKGTFAPNGSSLLDHFFAYGLDFNVGAFVAVGDTTGSGFGDIITGASIGNPDVHVYSGQAIANHTFDDNQPQNSQRTQFYAYDLGGNLGVTVGAGDFEHNGHYDIITGPTTGTPTYRVVRGNSTGTRPPAVFEGTPPDLTDGISVGA